MVQPRNHLAPGSRPAGRLRELLSPGLFQALSDPRRVALLLKVAQGREPATVSQLAEGSGVDLSVVSRHLKVLREAGIVQAGRSGREVRYVLRTASLARSLREVADALEACCPTDPSPPARRR